MAPSTVPNAARPQPSVAGLSSQEFIQIIDQARWAPSGDNCQPWRVRTSHNDCAEVLLDTSQQTAFLDTRLEASRIAIGAFVENTRLAASSLGVPTEITFADSDTEPIWARLEFARQRSAKQHPLAEFVTARVSNRRLYEPGSCSQQDISEMLDCIQMLPGVEVHFFSSPEQLRTIAEAVGLADRVRMQHRQCHEEFHEKVRWNAAEAAQNPTGFYVNTFEIKPHEALALRLTRPYGVMRLVDALSRMSAMAAAVARRQVIASGAVGMLSVPNHSPQQLLYAGQALQRLWLTATKRQLAFQMLSVAPIFIRRVALGEPGFTARQRSEIAKSRAALAAIDTAPPPEDVILMFRIGRAAPPSARTGRLPAETLLL